MNYSKINLFDIANGKGIRVSLFLSGCKFNCEGCFNQEQQNFNYGKLFTKKEEELILNRLKDSRFAGLSLLGGDPLCQNNQGLIQLLELCKKVHELGKDIWLWSGFTWKEIFNDNIIDDSCFLKQDIVKQSDIFVDGRFILHQKDLDLAWKGSTNQRVIDVKKSLDKNEIVLYNKG